MDYRENVFYLNGHCYDFRFKCPLYDGVSLTSVPQIQSAFVTLLRDACYLTDDYKLCPVSYLVSPNVERKFLISEFRRICNIIDCVEDNVFSNKDFDLGVSYSTYKRSHDRLVTMRIFYLDRVLKYLGTFSELFPKFNVFKLNCPSCFCVFE